MTLRALVSMVPETASHHCGEDSLHHMDDALKPERRSSGDRRRSARGGRRPYDAAGFAPLVLVVGDSHERQSEYGTILSRLQFAVVPATDVAEALRVIDAVHPDLIVAGPDPADRLRRDESVSIPVVEFDGTREEGDALVERITTAIQRPRAAIL